MVGSARVWLPLFLSDFVKVIAAVDLVIQIPQYLNEDGISCRLDYYPPIGHPIPNTTYEACKNIHEIPFTNAIPGTKYSFSLYYSNVTSEEITISNFTTAPDPPTGLSVLAISGHEAVASWSPPTDGGYTSFKLKLVPFANLSEEKSITIDNINNTLQYTLADLEPGASYQVQVFTVFEDKESADYISGNFTTTPITPGTWTAYYRSENVLGVFFDQPNPRGIFSHYKTSIDPPDAKASFVYGASDDPEFKPAQVIFNGLFPGRAYNISIQTVSEEALSNPRFVQFRTDPLSPSNVTFDNITTNSFIVHWKPPLEQSEFDKYEISIVALKKPVYAPKNGFTEWEFKDDLEPGKTYAVTVKTVSGDVWSEIMSAEVTLAPLPVNSLRSVLDKTTRTITISWEPHPDSTQDGFLVSYHEVENATGFGDNISTNETKVELKLLVPEKKYSVTVQALSKDVPSKELLINVQNGSIIEEAKPMTSFNYIK